MRRVEADFLGRFAWSKGCCVGGVRAVIHVDVMFGYKQNDVHYHRYRQGFDIAGSAFTPCNVYQWPGTMSWFRSAQSHGIVDNIIALSCMYGRQNNIPKRGSAQIAGTRETMQLIRRYDESATISSGVYPV